MELRAALLVRIWRWWSWLSLPGVSLTAYAQEAEPPRSLAWEDAVLSEEPEGDASGAVQEPVSVSVQLAGTPDLNDRQRLILRRALEEELQKRATIRVPSPPVAQASSEHCLSSRDTPCLTRLAKLLGVDEVLQVNTTRLGETRVLTIKRIRIRDGEVLGADTRRMTGSEGEEYLLILDNALDDLFAQHELKSGKRGGVRDVMLRAWNPSPVRPWMFWSGVGLTAVALLGGALYGVGAESAEDEYRNLLNSGTVGERRGIECRREESGPASQDRQRFLPRRRCIGGRNRLVGPIHGLGGR